jgi:hypothetical protein
VLQECWQQLQECWQQQQECWQRAAGVLAAAAGVLAAAAGVLAACCISILPVYCSLAKILYLSVKQLPNVQFKLL